MKNKPIWEVLGLPEVTDDEVQMLQKHFDEHVADGGIDVGLSIIDFCDMLGIEDTPDVRRMGMHAFALGRRVQRNISGDIG